MRLLVYCQSMTSLKVPSSRLARSACSLAPKKLNVLRPARVSSLLFLKYFSATMPAASSGLFLTRSTPLK